MYKASASDRRAGGAFHRMLPTFLDPRYFDLALRSITAFTTHTYSQAACRRRKDPDRRFRSYVVTSELRTLRRASSNKERRSLTDVKWADSEQNPGSMLGSPDYQAPSRLEACCVSTQSLPKSIYAMTIRREQHLCSTRPIGTGKITKNHPDYPTVALIFVGYL
jgi:hypothetical protein